MANASDSSRILPSQITSALKAERGPTQRVGQELFFCCFYLEKHHGDAHPSARWSERK